MFETGPDNSALIGLLSGALAHPVTNSLAYTIYKLLPNDTDFSIYKAHGLSGYNFAIVRSASLYSLAARRHGASRSALAAAPWRQRVRACRQLADTDLTTLSSDHDASYFDVFGKTVLVWPAYLNLPESDCGAPRADCSRVDAAHRIQCCAHALGHFGFDCGSHPTLRRRLASLLSARHLAECPAPRITRIRGPRARPLRGAGACWCRSSVAAIFGRRAGFRAMLLVNWLALAILATVAAALVSGASYLFALPAAAFAIGGWIEILVRRQSPGALSVGGALGFVGRRVLRHFRLARLRDRVRVCRQPVEAPQPVRVRLGAGAAFCSAGSDPARSLWLAAGLTTRRGRRGRDARRLGARRDAQSPYGLDITYLTTAPPGRRAG